MYLLVRFRRNLITFVLFALSMMILIADGRFTMQTNTELTCFTLVKELLDLSKHGLRKVPPNLPINTQYLDLSYNNISSLHGDDLEDLPNLCVLKLTHNGLEIISPLAFQYNPRIQVLDVSFNVLKIIPDLNLPDLRVLDLSQNLYNSYSMGRSFQNLLNLTSLGLGSPLVKSINTFDFAPLCAIPLKNLQLGAGAEMSHFEPGSFTCLPALQEMTLKMSFCEKPLILGDILRDLDRINVKSLTLKRFVPDHCDVTSDLFEQLKGMQHLLNITFTDTFFNSSVLTNAVSNVMQSSAETLSFFNITFAQDTPEGVKIHDLPGYNKTVRLRVLTFHKIHHHQYYFPLVSVNTSLFPHLTHLKFSGTGMSIIPCNLISALQSLEVLDLSDNILHNHGLWWSACSSPKEFPSLKQLYLRNNQFKDLQFISNHTHEMKHLNTLDLSKNVIQLSRTNWSPHLMNLSLSNNLLGDAVFDYLSPYMQTLNLSQTGITKMTSDTMSQLPDVRHLFLSFNNIKNLPSDLWAPNLEELHVDHNSINIFPQSAFKGLLGLRRLKAGNNPFICNCELYWFATSFNKTILIDWPEDYTCSAPASLAGITLEKFHPSRMSCDPWLRGVVGVATTILVTAAFGLVFYACDGAWYLQMLWVWMRVKQRGNQKAQRLGQVFDYHAFISYSQKDSWWVECQLVSHLERENFKLCIHERDFVPGDWIIDNIISCLERSSKTLFVLSQNFIQSNWCTYELFFAQHQAWSIQQDSLVFILLEPIPINSLPRKFLKLRSLLWQQTYLKWPNNDRHKEIFWARLKSLLQASNPNMVLEHVAKEMCPLLKDTA